MKTHFKVDSSASAPDDVHPGWKPHQLRNEAKTNQLEIIPTLLDDHCLEDLRFKPNQLPEVGKEPYVVRPSWL